MLAFVFHKAIVAPVVAIFAQHEVGMNGTGQPPFYKAACNSISKGILCCKHFRGLHLR